jgi:hypothetical protein
MRMSNPPSLSAASRPGSALEDVPGRIHYNLPLWFVSTSDRSRLPFSSLAYHRVSSVPFPDNDAYLHTK